MKRVPQFFPFNLSPVQFHVRHAGEPILMALDINSDLDFGLPSKDKKIYRYCIFMPFSLHLPLGKLSVPLLVL